MLTPTLDAVKQPFVAMANRANELGESFTEFAAKVRDAVPTPAFNAAAAPKEKEGSFKPSEAPTPTKAKEPAPVRRRPAVKTAQDGFAGREYVAHAGWLQVRGLGRAADDAQARSALLDAMRPHYQALAAVGTDRLFAEPPFDFGDARLTAATRRLARPELVRRPRDHPARTDPPAPLGRAQCPAAPAAHPPIPATPPTERPPPSQWHGRRPAA